MNRWRVLLWIVAPVPIVLGSMHLSRWMRPERLPPASNQAIVRGQEPPLERSSRKGVEPVELTAVRAPSINGRQPNLQARCDESAQDLAEQLGPECSAIARAPFVIAGDCTTEVLNRWHEQTIGPAARALAHAYFRVPPDEPIRVLLFSGERSYNHYARLLYGDEGISVYGYYKPAQRTLVMNISTGGGTLVHELTHALMDFDFPQVPDWFNEGLASLHEQCHIRRDESGIDGLVNWRLDGLQRAMEQDKLRSLRSLIGDNDFRGKREGLNYAQARYFCLYMQEQGVLEEYFQKFRDNQQHDPLGYKTVAQVFPERSWDELDADFLRWVAGLKKS